MYVCNTSSHDPLSLQSYAAELEVNKKEPSPFQLDAASLHIVQDFKSLPSSPNPCYHIIICIIKRPHDQFHRNKFG